ncbi:MAG: hypothetical protein WBC85_01730 [Planktotalea sp.]|uniref:hypothetical protein n=1 Tax=Planktotalea sp. TaxID=2029877 RepID=UPI003C783B27
MLAFFTAVLGLFPAIFLTSLQVILLIILGWLVLNRRQISWSMVKVQLNWTHLALGQFFLFFLVNSIVFTALPGTPDHYRSVAIESWVVSLLALLLLALFLAYQEPTRLKAALIGWLPVGLCITFAIATVIFISGLQGPRIHIATPNPLVPPLWFLILTLCSFTWFAEMSRAHKALRVALFIMAGLMALYAGARLVMLAWLFSGLLLGAYLIAISPPRHRTKALLWGGLILVAGISVMWLADRLAGALLSHRLGMLFDLEVSREELRTRFPRLVLWDASLAVISEQMPWGAGNINERILIQNEIGWTRWLRAHQSYLSYLIAGGPLALISGVILQLPVLYFLRRNVFRDKFPAFIGLGAVLALNCLTDSILQSAVAVQAYMVILLLYQRAR